ncbi:LacI family DNA-binding transcriptional regulator [Frondihabitans sp. PhB188]|uniref:LacI family DNA-binding transcriptional regulator n=1 Tax=Frondihabitans sp. PhB188 TaxID=2485200 RepID=UPI0013154643|nr:LacI family DNA-binding transcriptional regulator [Frondihabitans sp. PhB188]
MSVDEGTRLPSRRPTIRDVAAQAGVSKSVASRVYSGSTHVSNESRRRVLEAAETLGFRPNLVARSLAGQRDDFVGILVADLYNPVFAEVVDAARSELALFGKAGLLTSALSPGVQSDADDTGREGSRGEALLDDHAVALFGDLRPARLLVVGSVPSLDRVVSAAPHARIVAASSIPEAPTGIPFVRGDDDAGMRLLIDHLIEEGHSDIAHVGGPGSPVSTLRADAFRRLMAERGLGDRARVVPGGYTRALGLRGARSLLETQDPPTAIIAVNDLAGLGVLEAADAHAARTGRRVAVTGYDNTFLAALPRIALTSVDPGSDEIGREAARLLLDDADVSVGEVLVAPKLIVRESSRTR